MCMQVCVFVFDWSEKGKKERQIKPLRADPNILGEDYLFKVNDIKGTEAENSY